MEAVNEEYHRIEDVAERLKVSDRTVRRWIEEGKLVAIKLAESRQGGVRITETDLRAFLEARRTNRG